MAVSPRAVVLGSVQGCAGATSHACGVIGSAGRLRNGRCSSRLNFCVPETEHDRRLQTMPAPMLMACTAAEQGLESREFGISAGRHGRRVLFVPMTRAK